jgi:hypothetical protein
LSSTKFQPATIARPRSSIAGPTACEYERDNPIEFLALDRPDILIGKSLVEFLHSHWAASALFRLKIVPVAS